jgi:hypothetical protein
MMMIKGSNYHVMPDEAGWCVISESNRQVISHFESLEKATEYASQCAKSLEGGVLFHKAPYEQPNALSPNALSDIALPQQENSSDAVQLSAPEDYYSQAVWSPKASHEENFDPLLGFDAYYFDL